MTKHIEEEMVKTVRAAIIEAALTGGGSYRHDIDMLAGNPERLAHAAIAAWNTRTPNVPTPTEQPVEIVEKVARAAYHAQDGIPYWSHVTRTVRENYLRIARAAIAAYNPNERLTARIAELEKRLLRVAQIIQSSDGDEELITMAYREASGL